jgi:hypothetical protein
MLVERIRNKNQIKSAMISRDWFRSTKAQMTKMATSNNCCPQCITLVVIL